MSQVEPAATPTLNEPSPLVELAWVPLTVSLEAELENFAVRDLVACRPGIVVRSGIPQTATIPLLVNGKLMAWGKLEVIGDHLAARIVELA
ncbi:MAG TPA: FliM/FliN family flagellar motor C-terminal domain-containing protein [Terriglobales bacterium]|nr:FliM/FliN family flagellar motor C-terminal domain-containing protein [Terriglobales bacterium]